MKILDSVQPFQVLKVHVFIFHKSLKVYSFRVFFLKCLVIDDGILSEKPF